MQMTDDACKLQVPLIRTGLLKRSDWQQIADAQRQAFFGRAATSQQSKNQVDEMLKALDFMCNLQPDRPQHPVSFCTHNYCCLPVTLLCRHDCAEQQPYEECGTIKPAPFGMVSDR